MAGSDHRMHKHDVPVPPRCSKVRQLQHILLSSSRAAVEDCAASCPLKHGQCCKIVAAERSMNLHATVAATSEFGRSPRHW